MNSRSLYGALLLCGAAFALDAAVLKPVKVTGSSHVVLNTKSERHDPALAADGLIGGDDLRWRNYWASDFKAKPPHTLEFDFGKMVKFDRVRLDMLGRYSFDGYLNRYRIEYFDGKQYRKLAEEPGQKSRYFAALHSRDWAKRYGAVPPEGRKEYNFAPVTGSRVRLTVFDSLARLDEMTVAMGAIPERKQKAKPRTTFESGVRVFSAGADFKPVGKGKVLVCDRMQPDEFRRRFAVSRENATWQVPVAAPGYYRVFVMAGDYSLPSPGCSFTVNGQQVKLTAEPDGAFPWKTFIVHAPGKVLDFAFKGPWLFNVAMVAPLAEKSAFDAAVRRVVMGKAFDIMKHEPQVTHTAPPVPTAAGKARGFEFYTPSFQTRIFENTTPRANELASMLTGEVPRGSMKVLSLGVYAYRDIPDFRLALAVPEGLNARLFLVRRWGQRAGHKGSARVWAEVPELLDENRQVYLEKGTSLQFCVLVDVAENAPSRIWNGSVAVSGKGIKDTSIPFRFKVLPFTLDKLDGRQYAAMYTANYKYPFLTGKSDRALDDMRLKDMRKHNMNSVLYQGAFTSSNYRSTNELLDKAGFPRFPMPFHCQNVTPAMVREAMAEVRASGGREILFYPVDEPHFGRRHIAEKLYPMIKQTAPAARTYSTVSQQDVDEFGKSLDFRTYMITGYAKFEPDRIRRECARDKAIFWWYSNSSREYPAANRYRAGFFQYRAGATGQLYWAYDNPQLDPFNDFDGGSGDHCAVYTMGRKLVSTLQWEAIREGLDDLRCCYMLERLIAGHPGTPAALAGRKLLDEIRDATVIDLNEFKRRFGAPIDIHRCSVWEDGRFERYRAALLEAIMKFPVR